MTSARRILFLLFLITSVITITSNAGVYHTESNKPSTRKDSVREQAATSESSIKVTLDELVDESIKEFYLLYICSIGSNPIYFTNIDEHQNKQNLNSLILFEADNSPPAKS